MQSHQPAPPTSHPAGHTSAAFNLAVYASGYLIWVWHWRTSLPSRRLTFGQVRLEGRRQVSSAGCLPPACAVGNAATHLCFSPPLLYDSCDAPSCVYRSSARTCSTCWPKPGCWPCCASPGAWASRGEAGCSASPRAFDLNDFDLLSGAPLPSTTSSTRNPASNPIPHPAINAASLTTSTTLPMSWVLHCWAPRSRWCTCCVRFPGGLLQPPTHTEAVWSGRGARAARAELPVPCRCSRDAPVGSWHLDWLSQGQMMMHPLPHRPAGGSAC